MFPSDSMPSFYAGDASSPPLSRRSSLSRLFAPDDELHSVSRPIEIPSPVAIPAPIPLRISAAVPAAPRAIRQRATKYALTFFCPDEVDVYDQQNEILSCAEEAGASWAIAGVETCPTSGRKHNQVCFIFPHARSFDAIRNLPVVSKYHAHVEKANGSPTQNFDYCSKEGDFKEIGERPVRNPHVRGILYNTDVVIEFLLALRRNPRVDPTDLHIALESIFVVRQVISE